MDLQDLSLTVFFPCYNEEENVERVTANALQVARSVSSDFEIIIVNDGSSDRTGELADALAADHAEVRVVHHPTNLGYGAALQSGFGAATKQWVFYTDGDEQFDLREIARLLPFRAGDTVVTGYRKARRDPLIRKINARCWGVMVNIIFGLRVRDMNCAFKLFPAKLFEQMELRSTGALIDTEIMAKAARLGYQIKQVGVTHYPRTAGSQTGADAKVILMAFRELLELRSHILQTVPRPDGK